MNLSAFRPRRIWNRLLQRKLLFRRWLIRLRYCRQFHDWEPHNDFFHDADGRPFLFLCKRCRILGHYGVRAYGFGAHVIIVPTSTVRNKHLTPLQVAFKLFRNRGYNPLWSARLSFPYWTNHEQQHLHQCGAKALPQLEGVALLIRDEEEKALKLFDTMEKEAPALVKRRGLSPDTFGFLYATRGWHPEFLCPLVAGDLYYQEHREELQAAIQRHSGK